MMDLADWNEQGVLRHAKEVGLSYDGIVLKDRLDR